MFGLEQSGIFCGGSCLCYMLSMVSDFTLFWPVEKERQPSKQHQETFAKYVYNAYIYIYTLYIYVHEKIYTPMAFYYPTISSSTKNNTVP